MSLIKVQIPSGVQVDFADHDATGRWIVSDLIRFRDGRLQNAGNWRQHFTAPVIGMGRAGTTWTLLDKRMVTAVATELKLHLYVGGERFDITPVRASGTLGSNPFATTSASAVVTVTHTAHSCTVADFVRFSGASAVGGLDLNGEWQVASVVDTNHYTITHTAAASSTVAAGGGAAVAYSYDIHTGLTSAVIGRGWGAGRWGEGAWGGPRAQSTATIPLRTWWLAAWGEDLLACHTDGNIYWWDATGGPQTRATLLSGAPTSNAGIVVSPEDRHLIAFGAGGDPLKVQWADQESLTNWTPGATTTANDLRLLSGSRIVAAMKVADEVLLWTDDTLYGLRYTGNPSFSHSLRRIAGRIGILAPKAMAELNDVVYWMGAGQFYRYAGGQVTRLPCSIETTVFNLVDPRQTDKVVGGANPVFGEVTWFWPSAAGGGENDRYVKYCIGDDAWDWGQLGRTALIGRSASGRPLAMGSDSYVYEHEVGAVDQAVSVTLRCRKYAASTPVDFGPYTLTPDSTTLRIGARGRHVALKIEGVFWDAKNERRVWQAESSGFTVGEGDAVMRIDRVIPDIKFYPNAVRIGAFRFDTRPDGEQ